MVFFCNGLRYVFVIIVISLIGFAAYTLYSMPEENLIENENVISYENIKQEIITNIRLGITDYDTMNPLLSKNKNIQLYDKLIFEPLLTVEQDFSLSKCLATEYSKTGDSSYIIKLRNDVKWQDGHSFTSADVQYTIEKLKSGIDSIYVSNVQAISSLELIDDYTIKINLFEETPFFEYNLIFPIMPAHYYYGVDFVADALTPLGTGMFKIENISSTQIKLARNDNWWNKEKTPKLESIIINVYSNLGDIFNAFKIGNVDLLVTENVNFEDYIGTIGFNYKIFKGREYDFLVINTANNVLSKIEVRQAINYGIDKNNIVASIFNNKAFTLNNNLDTGNWLYSSANVQNEYDIEKAQNSLINADWVITSRQWQKIENYKTLRTTFNLVVNSNNAERVAVAENIKEQLANIGIIINIRKVNDWTYNNYIENKNYDILLTGTNISINPNLQLYFGDNNLANYSNEEINKMLTEVKNITDKQLLKEKYSKIQEITNQDIAYIPLYINKNVVLYSSNLVGDVSPNWYNIFYNIENWYRQN